MNNNKYLAQILIYVKTKNITFYLYIDIKKLSENYILIEHNNNNTGC